MLSSYDASGVDSGKLALAFGEVVREARKERGFSQEAFADHVGLHRTYMGLIERGKNQATLATVQRIAAGLGLRMSELLHLTEEKL